MKTILIYILLVMSQLTLSAGFEELHIKPLQNKISLNKSISGKDYLCFLSLEKTKFKISSIKSNCACIEILKVPSFDDKKYEAILLFKPIRLGPYAVTLSVEYSNKAIDKILIKGLVVDGDISGNVLPVSLLKRELESINSKLYASARQILKDKNAFIVDVRTEKEFELSSIPSAKQMPVYSIRTQEWLKNKTVYLLDDGVYKSSTENSCIKLRSLGFKKSYILQGGLSSWTNAGGKLTNSISQGKLNTVAPVTLILSKNFKEVVLVNDLNDPKQLQSLLPWAVTSSNLKIYSSMQYICVTDKETFPFKDSNVFYIRGGFDGVKKILDQFSNRLKKGTVISKRENCGNCPQ